MSYEVWLTDPLGQRLILIDRISSLSATRVTNNVGILSLTVPSIYDPYIRADNVIEVWRDRKLFDAYFIRKWKFVDDNNKPSTIITAYNGINLLDRRIVAYSAHSEQSEMTDNADDMMKAIVRYAVTDSATDADRRWTNNGFVVDGDLGAAPSISMAFAYRNVLEVLYDIAGASRQSGTRLYFDVLPMSRSGGLIGWRFCTNIGQPGIDRTGVEQVVFSTDFGNLYNPELMFDHTDERNVIYAGGPGTGVGRVVVEVEDVVLSKASPWARYEAFTNCSGQAKTKSQITAAGKSELINNRPRMEFSGDLTSTTFTPFKVRWDFGDLVVVGYRGYQYNAIINMISIALDGAGKETIKAGFEVIDG